jgi:hypothetical protein
MPKREPFRVMLDADLKRGLEALHEQTGASIAESIRRAVRAYLAGQPPSTAPRQKRTKKR